LEAGIVTKRLASWWDDSHFVIDIICTGRKTHEPKRVGEVGEDGTVVTIGGPRDLRQPSPRGSGHSDVHPEPCPECDRNFRHSREYWQRVVAMARDVGGSSVDASLLPDKLPSK
jgi:hypothetical protein